MINSTPSGAAPHESGTRTPVVHKPYSPSDFTRPPLGHGPVSEHTSTARSEALAETLGMRTPIGFGHITKVGANRFC